MTDGAAIGTSPRYAIAFRWSAIVVIVIPLLVFVPGSIPTMAAGALFGLWVGLVTVSISSTIGAMLAFLIARYLARRKVSAIAKRNRKFDAIDQAVGEGGWRIVALLRLSPVIPFNLQNYLYGLMPIRFWPCALATWLAMLPDTFMFVYAGHIAGAVVAGERKRTIGEWVILTVGLVATIVVTIYITHLARKNLNRKAEVENREEVEEKSGAASEATGNGSRQTTSRWGTMILVLIAILPAVGSVAAQLNRDAIESWLP